MIVSAGVKMICDGGGCSQVLTAETSKKAVELGKAEGWTYKNDGGERKHYCLNHTSAHRCSGCARYIVPRYRNEEHFPKNWVKRSRYKGLCQDCIKNTIIECSHPECDNSIYGETWSAANSVAMEQGWTRNTGGDKYFCLEHTAANHCEECDRFVIPHRRPRSQFPKKWVTQGNRLGICSGCEESIDNGTLHDWTKKTEKAGEQYLAMAPALAEFIEREDEQVRYDLARRLLDRCGAQDVARLVLG